MFAAVRLLSSAARARAANGASRWRRRDARQEPVAVHRRMPVVASVERGRQLVRRPHVGSRRSTRGRSCWGIPCERRRAPAPRIDPTRLQWPQRTAARDWRGEGSRAAGSCRDDTYPSFDRSTTRHFEPVELFFDLVKGVVADLVTCTHARERLAARCRAAARRRSLCLTARGGARQRIGSWARCGP